MGPFGVVGEGKCKKQTFTDKYSHNVTIEGYENAWKVWWADASVTSKEIAAPPEDNFKEAYDHVVSKIGELEPCIDRRDELEKQGFPFATDEDYNGI